MQGGKLVGISMKVMGAISGIMVAASLCLARLLVSVFARPDACASSGSGRERRLAGNACGRTDGACPVCCAVVNRRSNHYASFFRLADGNLCPIKRGRLFCAIYIGI